MPDLADIAKEFDEYLQKHPMVKRLYERDDRLRNELFLYRGLSYGWPTAAEAAKLVDVHRGTISRWVHSGKLAAIVRRGRLFIEPGSLVTLQRQRMRRMEQQLMRRIDD